MNIKNTNQNDKPQKQKEKTSNAANGLKIPKAQKEQKQKKTKREIPKLDFVLSWIQKLDDFIELKYVFMIIGVIVCLFLIRNVTLFDVAPQLINPEVTATDSEQSTEVVNNPVNKYEVTEDFYNALITEGIIAEDYIEVNGEMDYTTAQEFAVQYETQTGRHIKPEYNNCNFDIETYLDLLSDGSYAAYEEQFLNESQACNVTTDADYRIYLGYLDLDDANDIVITSLDGGYTMDELTLALEDIESPDVYISLLMRMPEIVIAGELINNEAYVPSYTGSTVTYNSMDVDEALLEDINEELGYSFNGVYQYKITTETDGEKDIWVATVLTNGVQCYLYDIELTSEEYGKYKQAKTYLKEN